MAESAQPLRARFLVGPTAVGKTAVARWIAEAEGCDILSADSMAVYRGMDIGTAKPGAAERARVRYHGIDLVPPSESFSVWDYRVHAVRAISRCAGNNGRVLVVGGTGLYVKSLVEGLDPAPGADHELRAHWEKVVAEKGLQPLREELIRSDPDLYRSVRDKQNVRRLIRALELARAGIEPGPGRRQNSQHNAPFAGLSLPSDVLKYRIELRVNDMYRQGLLEEVRSLLKTPEGLSPVAKKAIGYEEAIDVLRGGCSPDEARQRTVSRTWQLARRQMTWFRHQANVEWIEAGAGDDTPEIASRVLEHWRKYGATAIAE